jgi:hypothetical protein
LLLGDVKGSIATGIVVHELNRDDYGLHAIEFGFGDTVVDIGAHVGIFSMYLARRYPFLSIIALEGFGGEAVASLWIARGSCGTGGGATQARGGGGEHPAVWSWGGGQDFAQAAGRG